MALILKVISYKNVPPAQELGAEFDEQGGGIGRAPDNLLVLPDTDKFVSRRHASILFEGGQYFIHDSSTCGTSLELKDILLQQNRSALEQGETVRIGEYVLQVTFTESAPVAFTSIAEPIRRLELAETGLSEGSFSTPEKPVASTDFYHTFIDQPESSVVHQSFALPPVSTRLKTDVNEELALEDLLSTLNRLSTGSVPSPDIPLLPDDFFSANDDLILSETTPKSQADLPIELDSPAVPDSPAQTEIAGLDITSDNNQAVQHQIPAEAHAISFTDSMLLQAFLQGLGIVGELDLPPDQLPALMKTAGTLLHDLIDGLMQVLRARAEFKSQFRVSFTTIRPIDNNPLKFTPQVNDAIKLMLSSNHSGFLLPDEAIHEGFTDIMNHQIAMTAGIQAALTEMLGSFDPQLFEKSQGEGLVFQKKAKCWETYKDKYPLLKATALEQFFGEAFSDAYEKQIQSLSRSLKSH